MKKMLKDKKEAAVVMCEAAMLMKELADYFYYQVFPEERPEEDTAPEPKQTAPEVTLEEVRGVLAALSHAGKAAVVKQLLKGFRASKLSQVDPKDYWVLMAQAQEAQNAQ
ncbi:MAG: DNA ligase [Clostridia bacterium]|nr:DNA ligase [Clostridia bacterium]